jgi:uncharacterized membrane protein
VVSQVLTVYLLSSEIYWFTYDVAQKLAHKTHRYALALPSMSLSILWAVYASVLVTLGIKKKTKIIRMLGVGLLFVAILKIFIFDLSFLQSIHRILSFIVLGGLLLGVSYLYNSFKAQLFGGESVEK